MEAPHLELLPAGVSAGMARPRGVGGAQWTAQEDDIAEPEEVDEEDRNEDEDWDDAEDWDEDWDDDDEDAGDGGVAHAPGVVQFSRPFPPDTRPRIVRCAQLVF